MVRRSALASLKHLRHSPKEGKENASPILRDYKYSPLRSSSSEIRIFELCPAVGDEIVSGKLIIAPQGLVANNYAALSYCWGLPAKTKAIYCDGRRLMVTPSLYSALRRLRKLGISMIWADAICINQSDDVEKGAQVQIMGEIYEHAQEVICDLGEADWEPQPAIELLRMIISSLSKLEAGEPLFAADFQQYSLPDVHDEKWQGLRILLRLPWFRRLWVQRELALAKNAHMLWGLTLFEWKFLDEAIVYTFRYQIDCALALADILNQNDLVTVNQIRSMGTLRNNTLKKKEVRLIDLVHAAQGAEVTDPRDKIYSILGLTVDASDPALCVNYSESTSTVYTRVSQRLVKKYGGDQQHGIRLLYFSTGPRDGSPSWAIDWNKDFSLGEMAVGGKGIYHATEGRLPKMHVGKDDSLVVAGSKFDSIEKVTSIRTESVGGGYSDWESFCDWEAEAHALIDDLPTYPTFEPSMHAYMTTLIGDSHEYQKLDGSAIADSYAAYFAPYSDDRAIRADLFRRAAPFRFRAGAVIYRRFCVTGKGYFGLVPAKAQVGDLVCLLLGGDAPVVLRRDESDGLYIYIGDCYVHGIMNGEAMKQDGFHVEDFVIK
jgi:hypothetical protein